MSRKVSVSKTGQNLPKPNREERDAAFSKDGGRKAVEEPVDQQISESRQKHHDEPIGLEMETAGDQ